MRKNNNYIGNVKKIFFGSMAAVMLITTSAFATENEDVDISDISLKTTEAYEEWNKLSDEEKESSLLPQTVAVDTAGSILNEYNTSGVPNVISNLLGKTNSSLDSVKATASQSRYTLNDTLNMRVEHQGSTSECWNFAMIKSLETNEALKNNTKDLNNYSERHMDYATSKTFSDGTNPIGFNREVGDGGVYVVALAYLTNGTGAVTENKMPFQNNENKVDLKEIKQDADRVVTDYYTLPGIYKIYQRDSKGNTTSVTYKDASGKIMSAQEITEYRNLIKEEIVKNGSIASMTAGNHYNSYLLNKSVFDAVNYNCNEAGTKRDHAVSIVGWDDNYSKDNFKDGTRPSQDGAYIVLNSYGEESFNDGYLYISYEDLIIENELYSIVNTSNVDYSKIYQNDFYGGVYQIGSSNTSTGYIGTIFEKSSDEKEIIDSIGITAVEYASYDIYINPNGNNMSMSNMIKVGSTDEALTPGYHKIAITPTEINANEFSIVIKQKSEEGSFYVLIESKIEGTALNDVTSSGKSYISTTGTTWSNLAELNLSGVDMASADVCIKAYAQVEKEDNNDQTEDDNKNDDTTTDDKVDQTEDDNKNDNTTTDDKEDQTEDDNKNDDKNDQDGNNKDEDTKEKLTSEKYKIIENDIKNVTHETKVKDFKNNLKTELVMTVKDEKGNEVEADDIVKTGMKLILSDASEYDIIVRGDINKDGKVTLTDLSKLILQYNGNKGFELTGASLKACDVSIDNQVTITDVSQMIILYNSL